MCRELGTTGYVDDLGSLEIQGEEGEGISCV